MIRVVFGKHPADDVARPANGGNGDPFRVSNDVRRPIDQPERERAKWLRVNRIPYLVDLHLISPRQPADPCQQHSPRSCIREAAAVLSSWLVGSMSLIIARVRKTVRILLPAVGDCIGPAVEVRIFSRMWPAARSPGAILWQALIFNQVGQ